MKKNTEYATKMKSGKSTLILRDNYKGMPSTEYAPVTYSDDEVMNIYMKKVKEVSLY